MASKLTKIKRKGYVMSGYKDIQVNSKKPNLKMTLSQRRDFNLWVLLQNTKDAIYRVRKKELKQYDISTGQARVWFAIYLLGNKATPAEIARNIFREPHSISELLIRMEKSGLIKRVKDLKNNRIKVVLEEKGYQRLTNQLSHTTSISNIISVLSEEECRQLSIFLNKLQDKALEELGATWKPPNEI